MAGSFVITLREGLEASLIVAIILAYLARTGVGGQGRAVWAGVAAAAALSLTAGGAIFATVGALEGRAEQLFEGFAMLLAASVLTYMIVWMRHQSASVGAHLRGQVDAALKAGSGTAMFALAFMAVAREGLETALFLFAATRTTSPVEALVGGGLGLVAAVTLGYLVYRGSYRLDLRAFFGVSGVLLIFFAAGMVAYGIHELEEAGVVPIVVANIWDINWLLNEKEGVGSFVKALFGYNGNPSLVEAMAYALYLGGALWYFTGARVTLPAMRRREVA